MGSEGTVGVAMTGRGPFGWSSAQQRGWDMGGKWVGWSGITGLERVVAEVTTWDEWVWG